MSEGAVCLSRIIGVNTLVFNEELQTGKKEQWEFFDGFARIGFPFVEVRREFFRNLEEELVQTREMAKKNHLALFYSIPDVLFVEEEVNLHLEKYFEEAASLGAEQVKLTLGDYHSFTPGGVSSLMKLLEAYPAIKLTIENDQSLKAGSAHALTRFIVKAHEENLPVSLTFDTGNFSFIQEDAEVAARILADFVNYIHLKNVKLVAPGAIELALYETGDIKMDSVLAAFKEHVAAVIEYPCETWDVLEKQYHRIMKL